MEKKRPLNHLSAKGLVGLENVFVFQYLNFDIPVQLLFPRTHLIRQNVLCVVVVVPWGTLMI